MIDLKTCYPTYKGGCNCQPALDFIRLKFESCIKDKSKPFFVFETTATDTQNMQFILESTIKIVERENLQNMGLE